jgi:lipopolysaccharide transport system permease protein
LAAVAEIPLVTRWNAQLRGTPIAGVTRALRLSRPVIAGLVRRDLQLRSIRAVWGSAWLVIQPAMQIVIYTVIFAEVLRAKLPGVDDRLGYSLFLCAGLIHWNYFSELVSRSQTLFLEHADLVKTLRVPRSTLPVALLLSATVNYLIIAALFLLTLLLTDRWPGWVLLTAIPLIAVQAVLGLGIGVLSGTLNVFFRDVSQAMHVILQFWFWLTPIVYPISILPERIRDLLVWNPFFPIAVGYQQIVLARAAPAWTSLLPVALGAVLLAGISWAVFRALSRDLVDEL